MLGQDRCQASCRAGWRAPTRLGCPEGLVTRGSLRRPILAVARRRGLVAGQRIAAHAKQRLPARAPTRSGGRRSSLGRLPRLPSYCASILFAEGRNAVQVQRWLGHHSAAFTRSQPTSTCSTATSGSRCQSFRKAATMPNWLDSFRRRRYALNSDDLADRTC